MLEVFEKLKNNKDPLKTSLGNFWSPEEIHTGITEFFKTFLAEFPSNRQQISWRILGKLYDKISGLISEGIFGIFSKRLPGGMLGGNLEGISGRIPRSMR